MLAALTGLLLPPTAAAAGSGTRVTAAGLAAAAGQATEQTASVLDARQHGLVSQWDDAHYGRALPEPAAAGELLLTPGLLWAAAVRDAAAAQEAPAAYVARVRGCVASFLNSTEADGLPRVVNHDGTLAALKLLGRREGKGQLMLLTGPRSVGKSLMLQKMAVELAQQQRRVLYVDARQYGTDLTRGIIAALAADATFLQKVKAAASASSVAGILAIVADVMMPGAGAGAVVTAVGSGVVAAASPPRLDGVVGAFITACKRDGEFPVIFIDEANVALKAAQGDTAAAARVLAELNLFTRITKQQREASIVLATSEHGLPFRLRALGYDTGHISETIIAEEVPPAVMRDELMRVWGCGEHLATALLSMYGGHVLHASAAVRKLATSTAPASMKGIVAVGSIASAPALCLDDDALAAAGVPASEWPQMRERVTAALRALVVTGSIPLDSEKDKVAEIISRANVGCVIPLAVAASGVPPDAWLARTPLGEAPTHILVPSSHIMRLLIASKTFPPPPHA
jgi:energy-coupling factor transporter ATP-binding protein EcfA2